MLGVVVNDKIVALANNSFGISDDVSCASLGNIGYFKK
jgi:hypothetical protein